MSILSVYKVKCVVTLIVGAITAIIITVIGLVYQQIPSQCLLESPLPAVLLSSPDLPSPPVREKLAKKLLLVLVLTTFNHKRRDVIRKTWANGYNEMARNSFDVKFVIGTLQANETQQNLLTAENNQYNDLVLFSDHLDTYSNLTRKILQALIWVDQNLQQYDYILKIDDDSFARLDVIVEELNNRNNSKGLYWGYFVSHYKPALQGKWKEDRWFLCKYYLPYALGGAYLLSSDIVHHIALNADILTLYNNEDVSVGTWVSSFDIERHNDQRFVVKWTGKIYCINTALVLHFQTVKEMWNKHTNMFTKGVMC